MRTFRKRAAFAIIPVVGLLAVGEAAARLRLYFQHGRDRTYLFAPFVQGDKAPPAPVAYRVNISHERQPLMGESEVKKYNGYFKFVPGVYGPLVPYNTTFHINSLGFRGDEFDPNSTHPGVTRIFCVGESSTFGAESNDDATWPARLSHYLQERRRGGYEVINAGFFGYLSANMRGLITQELTSYHPDMIIVYAGVNDLQPEQNIEPKSIAAWSLAAHRRLYYRSMLYTLLLEKVSVMVNKNPVPMFLYDDKSQERFLQAMADIVTWAKEHHVQLVVVRHMIYLEPSLFMKDAIGIEEAHSVVDMDSVDQWGVKYADYGLSYRHTALMQALKQQVVTASVPFIDVRAAMNDARSKGMRLMYDFVHLTPQANDLMAREVERGLEAYAH